MVKHIVAWDYADGFTREENEKNARTIKEKLENLKNKVKGIISIQVFIHPVDTSQADILLECTFENEEALKGYTVHPEHVNVASNYVRPSVKNRRCIDFFID